MDRNPSYESLQKRVKELEKATCDFEQIEAQVLKLSHAVEQSPCAIMITDASGSIEYVNLRFTKTCQNAPPGRAGMNGILLNSPPLTGGVRGG